MTMTILSLPNPILRTPCAEIDLADIDEKLDGYETLDHLVADMVQTMTAVNGAGVAAPQVGFAIRLLVMDPGRTGAPCVMVNPIRNGIGCEMKWDVEGCLSCGADQYRVRRRKAVSVEWIDTKGHYHTRSFHGWGARVVQHELDHLDGQLIADVGRKVKKAKRRTRR